MVGIAFIAVLALGAYGAVQWIQTNKAIRRQFENRANVPGVSIYQPIKAPQRVQQVWAGEMVNSDQTVEPGYAPAVGPYENQPQSGGVIF